ncbi:DUF397 domain-containing protein [Streptomyces sp. NPDC007162]|uniref:DUF397 domain-containing protein n=1 Tax=Streptomyces sp. NPDC007162 TaxID=3156917 RepID=UPI0033C7728B
MPCWITWSPARSVPLSRTTSSRASSEPSERAAVHILHWRKSTYSGDSSNCVEMATAHAVVHIRDSKNPAGLRLTVEASTWAHFVNGMTRSRPQ